MPNGSTASASIHWEGAELHGVIAAHGNKYHLVRFMRDGQMCSRMTAGPDNKVQATRIYKKI